LPAENPTTPTQVFKETVKSQKASQDQHKADEAIDLQPLAKLIDDQEVNGGVGKEKSQGMASRGGRQATGEKDRW
jgi:hypothetical protein